MSTLAAGEHMLADTIPDEVTCTCNSERLFKNQDSRVTMPKLKYIV